MLARELVRHGLREAYGITGSGASWRLISALEAQGARYYPASHEAAAAIMAGASWRASGRLAAAIGIKGPGLANMLPGIAFNHFENLPVLSICEAYDPATPPWRMHKRLDHSALLFQVTKGSLALTEVPERLDQLLSLATEEVPGPVHLDLRPGSRDSIYRSADTSRGRTQPEATVRALELLNRSLQPILILGSIASRRSWKSMLPRVDVPTFTTAAAKGVIDESRPNALGVFTGDGKTLSAEHDAFAQCDLVLGLGLRNLEVLSPRHLGRPTIIVDEVGGSVADGFAADVHCVTSDSNAIEDMLAVLSQRSWGQEIAQTAWRRIDAALPADSWLPAACFHALNRLAYDYSLVVDTGSFCTIAEHVWRATPGRRFLGSSNGRFMGGSLPTAIGAAAASTEPVFCVTGDGGMRMYAAEIRLAARIGFRICFVLMSDGRFGSIAGTSNDLAMSRNAVDIPDRSWLAAVEGMGCRARLARDAGEFDAAIREWQRSEPLLIECRFAPQEYADMTRELR